MGDAVGIHPIVVLGSVIVGSRIAGVPGAIFGIPIAAVVSALFLHFVSRSRQTGPVAARAAARVVEREGRTIRQPREPNPMTDRDVEGAPDDAPDSAADAVGDVIADATGTNATKPAEP
jgi:hypothetical protein